MLIKFTFNMQEVSTYCNLASKIALKTHEILGPRSRARTGDSYGVRAREARSRASFLKDVAVACL